MITKLFYYCIIKLVKKERIKTISLNIYNLFILIVILFTSNNILCNYNYELASLLFTLTAVLTKITVMAAKVQSSILWCCKAYKLDLCHSYFVDDPSSIYILVEMDLRVVANLFCNATNQTIQVGLVNHHNSVQLYLHISPICYDL